MEVVYVHGEEVGVNMWGLMSARFSQWLSLFRQVYRGRLLDFLSRLCTPYCKCDVWIVRDVIIIEEVAAVLRCLEWG